MKKKNMFLAVTAVTILGVSALLSGCAEGMIDPAMAMKAQRVQASVQAGNTEEANAPAAENAAGDAAVDTSSDAAEKPKDAEAGQPAQGSEDAVSGAPRKGGQMQGRPQDGDRHMRPNGGNGGQMQGRPQDGVKHMRPDGGNGGQMQGRPENGGNSQMQGRPESGGNSQMQGRPESGGNSRMQGRPESGITGNGQSDLPEMPKSQDNVKSDSTNKDSDKTRQKARQSTI